MGINRKTRRNKFFIAPKLMLTSMMDMFTIVLIFLLFSFSDRPDQIKIDKDLELPRSSAEMDYDKNLRLVLSKSALMLDDEIVASLNNGEIKDFDQTNLKASLLYKRLRSNFNKNNNNNLEDDSKEKSTTQEIIFLCDKSHEFKLINQVMKTAGLAGYPNFQFAVLQER